MLDTTTREPPAGPDGSVDLTLVALPPIGPSSDPPADGLRPAALIYVIAVLAAGLATIVVFAPQIDRGEIPALILIGALAVGFSRVRMTIYGETALSIGMVGDFAVAFLFGPAGAAIASPLAVAIDRALNMRRARFNAGERISDSEADVIVRVNPDSDIQFSAGNPRHLRDFVGQPSSIRIAQYDKIRARFFRRLPRRQTEPLELVCRGPGTTRSS